MKIIDEWETQKKKKKKKKKKIKGDGSYSERVSAKSCYPFDMFLNPSFKMMKSFANIARTTASTSNLYTSYIIIIFPASFVILFHL